MKPPSGECNGDIRAADTSENKNVTPALVMLLAALVGHHSEWVRRGLAILQQWLLRPPAPPYKTDRGVSDTEASPLELGRVRLFMGRSDGGLALSPSDLQ